MDIKPLKALQGHEAPQPDRWIDTPNGRMPVYGTVPIWQGGVDLGVGDDRTVYVCACGFTTESAVDITHHRILHNCQNEPLVETGDPRR